MISRSLIERTTLATVVLFGASALWACGGPQVPAHDGYRSEWNEGWEKPKKLELDEDNEAEVDAELSYPKRRRVRWYSVELPGDGELELTLTNSPLKDTVAEEDEADLEDLFDVGMELYDAGSYRMLLRADKAEDDAGDRKKTRTAYELRKGTYLVHVYLQRRLDEAEFTLRVKYSSGTVEPQTDFPKHVAYVEDLAVVPALDDAPPPSRKPRPKCRGSKCRKKPKKDDPPDDPEPTTTATADGAKARIIVVRSIAGGTAITVNVGTNQGVAKGWKGYVVTKNKQKIPGGDFEITSVKNTSAKGSVNISPDAVKQAGYAILRAN